MKDLIEAEGIKDLIFVIRGHRVLLDRHLAELYDVETGALNRAVKRNKGRFPADFMFELTASEWKNLKCQIGTSRWGGTRALPHAFTEQGVAMLSGVLSSQRAVQVNIAIMRTFVKVRGLLSAHKDLAARLDDLERRFADHDGHITSLFDAIRELMAPPVKAAPKIGFKVKDRAENTTLALRTKKNALTEVSGV
ncbi:MAG: ORF6N domain-containing protein [Elusimicrobiota bacterium]